MNDDEPERATLEEQPKKFDKNQPAIDEQKFLIRPGSVPNVFYVGYPGQSIWEKESLKSYYIITGGSPAIMLRVSFQILFR